MAEVVENKDQVVALLAANVGADHAVNTLLRTNDKVLARITDGIYRDPQSAIRELAVNAYDADAENVIVRTDAPRFDSITVEDDGNGMGYDTLASVLFSIGGSYKRSAAGAALQISSKDDPTLSPGGRKLIGKMGIGLFSVAQLTHTFQIITKVKGEDTRTIALVALRQFSDSNLKDDGPDDDIESGQVRIWRESAEDIESHGTTIVLTSIRRRAREILSSVDVWSAAANEVEDDEVVPIIPPKYYVGYWKASTKELLAQAGQTANLPWKPDDEPTVAFASLVDAVWSQVDAGVANPKLETLFDNYLQAVWELSLALPLPYYEVHPFDLSLDEQIDFFALSSSHRGQADELIAADESLAVRLGLVDSAPPVLPFRVVVDALELSRPIRFRHLPHSSHAIERPMLFAGTVSELFERADGNLSGGPLEFEAYLLWNSKIAPTEHRGVLVRIHGASGTLFDEHFMHYQVAEIQRLRQAMVEIFVHEGLEGALNIDRESFNGAHPHLVYLNKWVHGAIRQFTSAHKKKAAALHASARDRQQDSVLAGIQDVVDEAWKDVSDDVASRPPEVGFVSPGSPTVEVDLAFDKTRVFDPVPSGAGQVQKRRALVVEAQMRAIAAILESHHVLDSLDKQRQEDLLRAIRRVLSASDD